MFPGIAQRARNASKGLSGAQGRFEGVLSILRGDLAFLNDFRGLVVGQMGKFRIEDREIIEGDRSQVKRGRAQKGMARVFPRGNDPSCRSEIRTAINELQDHK